jgi:hypothetical protein
LNDQCSQPVAEPSDADLQALGAGLRGLPELSPPPRVWQRISARAGAPLHPKRRRHAPLALAASLFAATAATVFFLVAPRPESPAAPEADLAALLAESRAIEARRRQVPFVLAPSDVERVLQVHIGGIDASLNQQLREGADAEARQALLKERIELMESLEQVESYRQREFFHQVVF